MVATDPPYTVAGAELFLSRAVEALAPEPGRHVFFSFGARRPDQTVAVQAAIAQLGLAVRSLTPNFNAYLGAGVLGGTSHLYHLRSTAAARPLITGVHDGALYTADSRAAVLRPYRCASCRGRARGRAGRPVAAHRRAPGRGLPRLRRHGVPAHVAG